jgi:hypothetical protein
MEENVPADERSKKPYDGAWIKVAPPMYPSVAVVFMTREAGLGADGVVLETWVGGRVELTNSHPIPSSLDRVRQDFLSKALDVSYRGISKHPDG